MAFIIMVYFQRGRFRNSGSTGLRLMNMVVAAGIGVISGQYIFKEPLEHYWAEQHAAEADGRGGGDDGRTNEGSTPAKVVTAASGGDKNS